MAHFSVLKNEVMNALDIHQDDIVVDGTINGGGHSFEIAQSLSSSGVLIGIDLDESALELSRKRLQNVQCQLHLIHGNFRNIDEIIADIGLHTINKILLDLGWSSNQFENPERGFSFMHEGPLLMTLSGTNDSVAFTAYDMVNFWEAQSLIDVIESYGEERYAQRIVQAIVQYRKNTPIQTTKELAEIISKAVPSHYRHGKIHPATKTFQALRIAVNDEMGALRDGLEKGFHMLAKKGRMVVISFHSVEDRIVKHFFKQQERNGYGQVLTKKPITASQEELLVNRRSRSAKLRVLVKT